ncbi:BREX-1 system adenine-specific DNA-methyltransferase PglX, partial [Nocardia cyriacigeorgica]|uniref:BREX-1 system adenine-specific DNA-methyltransferase PglX n=1 Tax=Nocardia cyriacigeorgica TaxID=135487 RepID=UPI001E48CA4C
LLRVASCSKQSLPGRTPRPLFTPHRSDVFAVVGDSLVRKPHWLFSSPKGSFNALIYLHRYLPSTVSTVLTYLREYVTKLEAALQHAERAENAKEADRLRTILVELNEYEHDTLYPKASENVIIDLDDGVKANYPKFGAALKKIPGLEAASD